jgi:enoyl-CoA hydratase/carnithine racemase
VTLAVDADLLARGHVRLETHDDLPGHVVSVILDRPDARNAQTPGTWAALAAIGDALAASDVTVAVIRGSGSAFSAGLDRRMFTPEGIPGEASLAGLTALGDDEMAARIHEFQRAFAWQRAVPALTVAAVHGPAVGAGFQLALACDILLASPHGAFAMRETSYGLVPDLAGTGPLVRAVGYSRAVDICATGRLIPADEGFALGFVTRVVPSLDDAVAEIAASASTAPPGAIADLLPLLAAAEVNDRAAQMEAERRAQAARLRALLGGA